MKKNILIILFFYLSFTILLIFINCIFIKAQENYLVVSLDTLIDMAKINDAELISLKYSLIQMVKAKNELIKKLLPSISITSSSSNGIVLDSQDNQNFNFDIKLNEVLFDQISFKLRLLEYQINIKQMQNKIETKVKDIERTCINLYLSLLLMEEKIKSKKMEIELFSKMVSILEEEVRIGSKKPLDLYEGKQKLLESQIELQQLDEEYKLSLEEVYSILKEPDRKKVILFKDTLESFFMLIISKSQTGNSSKIDEMELLKRLTQIENIKNILLTNSFKTNLELKSIELKILQIKSRLEIVKLLFLKNIQLSVGISISGIIFPPVNVTSSIILGFSIDFGIFSGGLNITSSSTPSSNSISSEASLSGFNTFVLPDNEKQLLIELKTTIEKYEQIKGSIEKELDSVIIQFHSKIQKYFLLIDKIQIMQQKKDIIETQLKIGEIKQVDYFNFLKELNSFYLSLLEEKNSMLSLIFKLIDLTQTSIEEIYYYLGY